MCYRNVNMAIKRRKTVRKSEMISFRVTPDVAKSLRKAVAKSSTSAGDFYNAGVLSLAINIDAFEAGILRGKGLMLEELRVLIYDHIHAHGRHGDHLYRIFDELGRQRDKSR